MVKNIVINGINERKNIRVCYYSKDKLRMDQLPSKHCGESVLITK